MFDGCRVRYKLRNRLISTDGPETNPAVASNEAKMETSKGEKLYVGSMWPISLLMKINSTPHEKLDRLSSLLDIEKAAENQKPEKWLKQSKDAALPKANEIHEE